MRFSVHATTAAAAATPPYAGFRALVQIDSFFILLYAAACMRLIRVLVARCLSNYYILRPLFCDFSHNVRLWLRIRTYHRPLNSFQRRKCQVQTIYPYNIRCTERKMCVNSSAAALMAMEAAAVAVAAIVCAACPCATHHVRTPSWRCGWWARVSRQNRGSNRQVSIAQWLTPLFLMSLQSSNMVHATNDKRATTTFHDEQYYYVSRDTGRDSRRFPVCELRMCPNITLKNNVTGLFPLYCSPL